MPKILGVVRDDLRVVIVGSKCDAGSRSVTTAEAEELARSKALPYIETSAKENIRVVEAFRLLATQQKPRLSSPSPRPEHLPLQWSCNVVPLAAFSAGIATGILLQWSRLLSSSVFFDQLLLRDETLLQVHISCNILLTECFSQGCSALLWRASFVA